MFDRTKRAAGVFQSVYQRRRELTTKLLQNPFFPILFIGEAVKTSAIAYATAGTFITPAVILLTVLAVVVTLLWLFAEVLLESASEYTDKGKEALEDVTDGDDT